MNTTEDQSLPAKKLDVEKAYAAYAVGSTTINEVADEHNMPAQLVVEAFIDYVQATKLKVKNK